MILPFGEIGKQPRGKNFPFHSRQRTPDASFVKLLSEAGPEQLMLYGLGAKTSNSANRLCVVNGRFCTLSHHQSYAALGYHCWLGVPCADATWAASPRQVSPAICRRPRWGKLAVWDLGTARSRAAPYRNASIPMDMGQPADEEGRNLTAEGGTSRVGKLALRRTHAGWRCRAWSGRRPGSYQPRATPWVYG